MITRTTIITLLMALILATAAQADVVNFGDSTKHWEGWGTWQENDQDTIGIPNFLGGQATITTGPGLYTLTSVDFFLTADKYESSYNSLTSGDLFLNTDNDESWNYVVRLNSDLSASVFAVDLSYTDANGYILGHAGGNYRDNHPAWAKLDGLTPMQAATWSGLPDYPGSGATGTVSISGLDIDYSKLSLAYSVSCANDVVFEAGISQTPIPGAVWLLGSGLMGLMGLRKRMVRA